MDIFIELSLLDRVHAQVIMLLYVFINESLSATTFFENLSDVEWLFVIIRFDFLREKLLVILVFKSTVYDLVL